MLRSKALQILHKPYNALDAKFYKSYNVLMQTSAVLHKPYDALKQHSANTSQVKYNALVQGSADTSQAI
jgi:hypothetical protein